MLLAILSAVDLANTVEECGVSRAKKPAPKRPGTAPAIGTTPVDKNDQPVVR